MTPYVRWHTERHEAGGNQAPNIGCRVIDMIQNPGKE